MQMQFSDAEMGLLEEIVQQAHQSLTTDTHRYEEDSKERERMLEDLLHKLHAALELQPARPASAVQRLEFDTLDADNKAIGGG